MPAATVDWGVHLVEMEEGGEGERVRILVRTCSGPEHEDMEHGVWALEEHIVGEDAQALLEKRQ